jgi:hypothetical protein
VGVKVIPSTAAAVKNAVKQLKKLKLIAKILDTYGLFVDIFKF